MPFISRPYHPPPDTPLKYLYVDSDLLVVNKINGLLSVPGRGESKQDCLLTRVQRDYADALIVHRLDMETSGVMVLARHKQAHRHLSLQFQNRQVAKTYVAIVEGQPEPAQGVIELPMCVDWPNKPLQKIDWQQGKAARTEYEVIPTQSSDNKGTRLHLKPTTGRTHQLRLHLFAIGHPILGDRLYHSATSTAKAARLLLHASELAFQHPTQDSWCHYQCAPAF